MLSHSYGRKQTTKKQSDIAVNCRCSLLTQRIDVEPQLVDNGSVRSASCLRLRDVTECTFHAVLIVLGFRRFLCTPSSAGRRERMH